jgi:hypothetical protein
MKNIDDQRPGARRRARAPDPDRGGARLLAFDPERRVVADLNDAGVTVRTVWELAAARWYPAAAVTVLAEHLARTQDRYLIRTLARALAAPHAGRRAYVELVAKLESLRGSNDLAEGELAEALGRGIARHARRWDLEELLRFVRDAEYGAARIPLLERIAGWRMPGIEPDLLALLSDQQLRPSAVGLLGRMRVTEALPCIRALLTGGDARERGAAQRALRFFTGLPPQDYEPI